MRALPVLFSLAVLALATVSAETPASWVSVAPNPVDGTEYESLPGPACDHVGEHVGLGLIASWSGYNELTEDW